MLEDGLVGVTLRLRVSRDGVVQVQHEHRSSVMFGVDQRPWTVRQPQDGEDLPLHLPSLLAA